MASFSTFCAAWVAAGLRSPCISAFVLAVIHLSLGSRGDSYRCAGSGSSEASRHLEGWSRSWMQVQFKITGTNTVDASPPPPNMTSAVVTRSYGTGDREGICVFQQHRLNVILSVSTVTGSMCWQSEFWPLHLSAFPYVYFVIQAKQDFLTLHLIVYK